MTLDQIPNGSRVLLDANILIYAKRALSQECRRLLMRCAQKEVHGFISAISIAEFCHRRMMQEAQSLGLSGSNPARKLGHHRELLSQLSQYRADVEDVISGDLTTLDVSARDILESLAFQHRHGLLTNDSLLLAVASRVGIQLLASIDPHFDQIPGITRCSPIDLPLVEPPS